MYNWLHMPMYVQLTSKARWALHYYYWMYNPDMPMLLQHCWTLASELPAATTWVGRWPIFWFKLLSSHLSSSIGLYLSIILNQLLKWSTIRCLGGGATCPWYFFCNVIRTEKKRRKYVYVLDQEKTGVFAAEANTAIQVVSSAHPITNTAGTLPCSWLLPCCPVALCTMHYALLHYCAIHCHHAHKVQPLCRYGNT